MKSLLIAAGLFGLATAACPNQCSGHGTCSGNDVCGCFGGWTGADCSQRKCAEDRAWATNAADPHAYTECSGQGVCNRQTGECECFDGFTGRACARSACPNDCSGNGVCKLLSEVSTSVKYDASNWDAKRIQTCECDAGFFGPDCSMKRCPTGDDPLTLCTSTNVNQVQEVRFTLGSKTHHTFSKTAASTAGTGGDDNMAIFTGYASGADSDYSYTSSTGQLRISYTDAAGGVFVGHAVDVNFEGTDAANTLTQNSVEVALETLPDQKVRDVLVASKTQPIQKADGSIATGGDNVPQRVYAVTFLGDKTNSNNVGLQNALKCDVAYSCSDDGCQPKVTMPFLYRYMSTEAVDVSGGYSGKTTAVTSYTGVNADTSADFKTNKKFVRLNSKSQPQLPQGIAVDAEANRLGATNFARYDMRVMVFVQDGNMKNGVDDTADVYYTKVILGHTNITSTNEQVGTSGVWAEQASAAFTGTSLDGFTYNGPIPSGLTGVAVPGAPGVMIDFPAANMVGDKMGRFFEILVKLPNCKVTPVTAANQVRDLSTFANYQTAVDVNVENIECSGRGQCNRKSGQCECYEGYYGVACHRQTTLV